MTLNLLLLRIQLGRTHFSGVFYLIFVALPGGKSLLPGMVRILAEPERARGPNTIKTTKRE